MAYTLFISHSSEDYDLVEAIREAARPLQIEVRAFEDDLQPGADLPQKLISRIRTSSAVLVLLTHAGAVSPAVHQEIGVALQAGRTVIPIVDVGVDVTKFTLLQGKEYLVLNRMNPSETLMRLNGRLAQMKNTSDRNGRIGFAILAGITIWLGTAAEDESDDEDEKDS